MRTSRRSALALGLGGGALLGVGLTGCDVGGSEVGGGSPGAAPLDGSDGSDAGDGDADRALVDDVLGEIDALLGAVLAAQQAFPGLRAPLAGLEQMHRAHRAALAPDQDAAGTPPPSSAPAPARARAALRGVRTGETAHEQALAEAALASGSGALARLLASMSASVTQHLAVLPTRPAGRA